MIASVHIANLGLRQAASVLRRAPRPAEVDGLRHADVAITAPLGGSVLPAPDLRRVGLIALWDSDAALDAFLDRRPLAGTLGGGWQVRLDPLRAWGSWPGLPSDLTRSRTVPHAGPAVVLTLGRVKLRRLLPFLRASA
ncbi:MAG: spheroidene monooxygenase, partial [Acidimicrobiia bacterium]|nr:spheroidene monooxygenase [Acidimicrobiia bacterium]